MSNEYTEKLVDGMSNDLLPGRKTKVKTARKRYAMPPTKSPLDDLVDGVRVSTVEHAVVLVRVKLFLGHALFGATLQP